MCENCADLVEVLNEISDVEGGDGLQLRKDHAFKIFAYINSWMHRIFQHKKAIYWGHFVI